MNSSIDAKINDYKLYKLFQFVEIDTNLYRIGKRFHLGITAIVISFLLLPKTGITNITNDSPIKDNTISVNSNVSNFSMYRKAFDEYHITAQYTYNNTWILNQNTYGQFKGNRLSYRMDFGSSVGIMAGYDVRREYGFEAGIIFRSFQGQTYFDKLSIGEFAREIDLEYVHIPVMYKFKKYLKGGKTPLILNIVTGIQYGRLLSALETVNLIDKDITERFNKNEIGLILNLENDLYLIDFFYLTVGLNSSIGNNINAQDWPVKDGVSETSHNLLIGLNFGMSYYFGAKKSSRNCSAYK
ncbi:MAG: PorT family protein [Bacteroidetes bacterium]|nr:PorT family protein [Bacteroidota bacterium]